MPKTYNNRRILRIITGAAVTIGLSFVILFVILFFVFQSYVVNGQLIIPWLDDFQPSDAVQSSMLAYGGEPDPSDGADDTEDLPGADPSGADGDQADTSRAGGNGDAPQTDSQPDTDQTDPDQSDPARDEKYTIEQIQAALEAQFQRNAFGERNPQVISIEEVERDRDSISLEGAGPDAPPVDLSNSSRFRVEYRFEQPIEEYQIWIEPYGGEDEIPFRRDGNHTIMTGHFYFNDLNGTPVLAFIMD